MLLVHIELSHLMLLHEDWSLNTELKTFGAFRGSGMTTARSINSDFPSDERPVTETPI